MDDNEKPCFWHVMSSVRVTFFMTNGEELCFGCFFFIKIDLNR